MRNIFNYSPFLQSVKLEILDILNSSTLPIKFNLKLEAAYNIPNVENSSVNRAFKTSARAIFEDTNIEDVVDEMFRIILTEQDVHQGKGSGFTLEVIDGILLGVYKYTPMGGSSYIETPLDIAAKKALINPQNDDQQCFKWSILAKHVTGDNKHRVGDNYKIYENLYNFKGISYPTPQHEIKIFEKNNPGTSVNLYGLEKNGKKHHQVYPIKVVAEKVNHFDLLIITNEENAHYTFISNFSRLTHQQKTKHHGKTYTCKTCFSTFDDQTLKHKPYGQEALDQHMKICGYHKPIVPKMPTEGTKLEFESWFKTQRHPVVIYSDFEALLVKTNESKGEKTKAVQLHKPFSYGLYVKTDESIPTTLLEKFNIPTSLVIHRGSETRQEVAKHFVETIVEISRNVEKLFKTNNRIIISKEEEDEHVACTRCNLCKKIFTSAQDKVQDHCHLSGKFRQTLCASCNLKLRLPNFIPCFMHNLSNYDAHFIVTELAYDGQNIPVIPNSEEKFISFSKYTSPKFTVRFVDTLRFMASKLSILEENLVTSDFVKFRETAKHFEKEEMRLVTRKGVYSYDYTSRWEVLEETELPSKENFYSILTEEHINDEEYEHAKEVWNHFECNTLGEYSDLYLKIDVLLLADIFENFREMCYNTYGLDPAFYYTAPGLSFDAMLKCTGVQLELLSDYDMLMMFENGNLKQIFFLKLYLIINCFRYTWGPNTGKHEACES